MKVLITGGAGFIGTNLARRLVAKGSEVVALDNLSTQIHGDDPAKSPLVRGLSTVAELIVGDVNCRADLERLPRDIDAVVHLAAETGTGQSMYEIRRYCDTNVGGTANVLEFIGEALPQVSKVVIASSRAIYGEGRYFCSMHGVQYPEARQADDMDCGVFGLRCPECGELMQASATPESSLIHPTSIYGITKHTQEAMVHVWGGSRSIATTALRYQNVYGPGQSLSNPYTGILSIFSTRILNGNPIDIYEDGDEARDFIYIDDVVDATALAVEDRRPGNKSFNVGTGVETSVSKVTALLQQSYNSSVETRITGKYRLGDIRTNYADISLINEWLGFAPRYSFEEGIKNFCNWVVQQEKPKDLYEASIEELQRKGLYK